MKRKPNSHEETEGEIDKLMDAADAALVETAQLLRGVSDYLDDNAVDHICDTVLRIQQRGNGLLEILEARQLESTLPDIASGDL